MKKLAANQARDRRVTRTLRRMGWRVVRIWEHELARKNEERLLGKLPAVSYQPSAGKLGKKLSAISGQWSAKKLRAEN